ncbi:MAG: hypothetical protein Q8R43_02410 [Alphaproteobacteria bacterium]|nr:hypothetical protein [Alphaproteobacteria bacterium]
MKRTLFALMSLFNISSAATQLTVEDGQLLSAVYAYMSKIPLPDGMSVLGNYVPGSKPFDFEHTNDDGNPAYLKAVELTKLLRSQNTSTKDRNQRYEDIIESYDFIVAELYRLTPDAVGLFEGVLTNSKLYGTPVLIPKQPERAAHYNKIAHWRVFRDKRPEDALEAIRLERERLDAIAAEEAAKRKAEADAKAAEESTRISAIEQARLEATSTLRRRKAHGTTTEPYDEHNATTKDPLLPRQIRAH